MADALEMKRGTNGASALADAPPDAEARSATAERRGKLEDRARPRGEAARPQSGEASPNRLVRRGALGRFHAYRPGVSGAFLISLVLALALAAPLLAPYPRDAMDLGAVLAGPSPAHPLGTDDLGRDVLTRLLFAARFSMLVALSAVAIATVIGVLAGVLAGFLGGAVDAAATVVMDLFLSVPVFLVLLVAAAAGGGKLWLVPLIIGAVSWVETARVVRSLVLSLRREGFVEAARAMGAPSASLMARHILPQALPAVIVSATVGFAQAMLVESALSFLGFGVAPPVPTWGTMLQNASLFIRVSPLAAVAPGFMIFITCLSMNAVGEGLRRALAIERESFYN